MSTTTRARRRDPQTSHAAARNAAFFADSHKGRIMAALKEGPRSSHGLAVMAGLADVLKDALGNDVIVGSYRVWVAK